ncbi:unnamed protein product [Closterium sp. NIES-64]|nr:unnamed protein product [Closterium sp. NIES-64]
MGGSLRIPQMGGRELDLHLLYREVTGRGGLMQVIADRKWRDVTIPFDFPPTTTSASYVLRKFYINLLHHFEQTYFFNRQGPLVPPPPLTHFPRKRGARRMQGFEAPPPPQLANIGRNISGIIRSKCDNGYFITVPMGDQVLHGILYHPPSTASSSPFAPPQPVSFLLNAFSLDSALIRSQTHGRRRRRKRRRRAELLAAAAGGVPGVVVPPKQNRTGYNFFFGEQRMKLKADMPDRMKLKADMPDVPDREISRLIGQRWMALSPQDRIVSAALFYSPCFSISPSLIGKRWVALSSQDRIPYQEQAERGRKQHVAEMMEYNEEMYSAPPLPHV